MPSYDPNLFNVSPYYDDYSEEKKFIRMLFRPGFAVQSRELTQLQTILQNQIERFGNHIFKDGSNIIGGEISTQTLSFIRIDPQSTTSPIFTISASDIVGNRLIQRDAGGNILSKAIVVAYLPAYGNADNYGVAIVSYLGKEFSDNSIVECDNPDKPFSVSIIPTSPTVPSGGVAKIVSVGQGIYYVNGFFVRTDDQLAAAYSIQNEIRNFAIPSGVMGLKVNSVIVTEKDDFTLKDPASGSYNYNAPGSHRYKIDLSLLFTEDLEEADFIELVSYSSGQVVKKTDNTQYSDLMKLFAQRTYDESGNYVTKPFDVSFRDGGSTQHFIDIGGGKAYAFGYEYETSFKDTIKIPRALTTISYEDYRTPNYYGNYLIGTYNPSTGDNITSVYGSLRTDENSAALKIYGATQAATPSNYLTTALFDANLISIQPDGESIFSTEGNTFGVRFRAHLTNINSIVPNSTSLDPVNLYLYDNSTGISTRILSDVILYRNTSGAFDGGVSTSTLPQLEKINNQKLIFSVNGETPTTLVKEIDDVEFVQSVYRAFVVSPSTQYPSVSLGINSDYNWCFADGFVPTGNPVQLDETDDYYIVYVSGTALPIGTAIKIVSNAAAVSANQTKVTANISGDGDFVTFTSALPIGSYYVIGKAKANIQGIPSAPKTKIRFKGLVEYSETITNTLNTIDTFKRVIRRNTAGSITEIYFVLNNSDVVKVNGITSLGVDISSHFQFDNGQREATYELARLYVKPEHFSKYDIDQTFQFTVAYSYYTHNGYGPFTVSSYIGISYDDIQVYVNPIDGTSTHLANAIDYRYQAKIIGYVPSSATAGTIISGAVTPVFNTPVIRYVNGSMPENYSIIDTHEAYLPRIDKLVVSRNTSSDQNSENTTLSRIAGVPSSTPLIPEDLTDSMTLFILSVPAYTFNATDIKAQSTGNNRYTMKDIGTISNRVDILEQDATLNSLELSIISQDLKNSAGEDAIKRAVIVDTFNGHSIGDVTNIDYRCSIDPEMGDLRPSFESKSYGFSYNGVDPGITRTADNIVCADYEGTTFIYQNKASDTLKVNVFSLPNWVGNIKMTPHADYWFDRNTRPIVKKNDNNYNDAWVLSNMNGNRGHGSHWNDWESIWNGLAVELSEAETRKNATFFSKSRSKTKNNSVESRPYDNSSVSQYSTTLDKLRERYYSSIRKNDDYVDIGFNTLLNKSISPYMRETTISFDAYNLKPATDVSVYIDGTNVDMYCSKNGSSGPFKTSTTDGSLLGVTLTIPSGLFETGDKIIRVIDSQSLTDATTVAEAIFASKGINNENPYGIYSIRPIELRKQTPNSSRVVANPLYRKKSINTSKYNQWLDPMAQTFSIDENQNPNGVYVDSVDLFFSSKDEELPVTVEICPVISEIPHTSAILPFSTVVLNPSAINASDVSPTPTKFRFTSPVYLSPGEYAIVIRTNSRDYSLYVANIGEIDIITNERISSTFSGGILYRAQNSSEPTGDVNTDLMFTINRCRFETPSTTITLNHEDDGEEFTTHLIQPNIAAFAPPNLAISSQINLGSRTYDATVNRNLGLEAAFTITDSDPFDVVITTTPITDDYSTFMLDLDKTNVVAVRNIINGGDSSTTVEQSSVSGRNDETARYITKRIAIPERTGSANPVYAKEMRVIFDAYIPKDTFIRVYSKMTRNEAIFYETSGYSPLNIDTSSEFYVGGQFTNSQHENDYREISFSGSPLDGERFDLFSVKICMYSNNSVRVPKIRNLRIIAIE